MDYLWIFHFISFSMQCNTKCTLSALSLFVISLCGTCVCVLRISNMQMWRNLCMKVFMATKIKNDLYNCRTKLIVGFHKKFHMRHILWRNNKTIICICMYVWIKLHQIEYINLLCCRFFFLFDFLLHISFYRYVSYQSTAIDWFLCFSIFITTAHRMFWMWFLVGQHQHWVIWSYYFFCCCCSLSLWCLNRKFARVTRESKKNTSNFNHTLLNWMWSHKYDGTKKKKKKLC